MEEDWRIEAGGDEVRGRAFAFRSYTPPRPDWDHDHCELCGAKFMQGGAHGSLAEGFATPCDGSPGSFSWACESCWNDLNATLGLGLLWESTSRNT